MHTPTWSLVASPSRTYTCVLAAAGVFGVLGCEPASGQKEPVFGGQGAAVQASALPSGMDDSVLHGPCSPAAPAGKLALLDDFEDADFRPFKEFQREGYWYAAADSTLGTMSPKPNAFLPESIAEAESTPQNRMAAHLSGSGYSDWGVVWGTTLRWVDQGTRCPFNASGFAGIKFKAKGSGKVRVNFGMPETIPAENEGTCKERCYDTHSRVVILTDKWETYEIPWSQLQQWGWGTQAPFDPSRLLNLQFAVDGKLLPIDFWVDDIEFMVAGTAPNGDVPPASSVQPATSLPSASSAAPASVVGGSNPSPRL